ncbi:MAG TPA: DUF1203 domain-containing protein [Candidatus Methylomirabilis sp.]|nr:DUF1203 domain-containing protein [Candidatus Methylomirabilis sp.]
MPPITYRVHPIDPDTLQQLRKLDDADRPPAVSIDDGGGLPLRCCLRGSTPGERVALVSYAPLRRWAADSGVDAGAYDETGPVFIHPESCGGTESGDFPPTLQHAPRVLRAYNHDGTIRCGVPVEADGPFAESLERLFAEEDVAFVHVRSLDFGCFTFAVERADRQ